MKVNLIAFQEKAVKELRIDIADAMDSFRRRGKTQVVSLQAPTGAGKTIIAASLIEDIFFGSTLADGTTFDEAAGGYLCVAFGLSGTEYTVQAENRAENQQAAVWTVCDHCRGIL